MALAMNKSRQEFCGKCDVELDRDRVVDFTLKNGPRFCESCFVRETSRPRTIQTDFSPRRQDWRAS
jgi:hypothetical protein